MHLTVAACSLITTNCLRWQAAALIIVRMPVQVGETEPFICELLTNLTGIIQDLETHQIHMFYETVGLMISAETVPEKRDEYVVRVAQPQ